ncbi:MAG: cyclase family protein [Candidatus Tectomicrobia bacterium]|nr:cyclase family protein [Candidatus Tectomicrobia bacterium]
MAKIPLYKELPKREGSDMPLVWGVWGNDDQLGMMNHITNETVLEAIKTVRRGARFNLDLPLHIPFGAVNLPEGRRRRAPQQTIYGLGGSGRDDKLDDFYLQGSTQWDGLTHVGDPVLGWYNSVKAEEITGEEGTKNGIEHWADFGIVARGVLVDMVRHFQATGRKWEVKSQEALQPQDFEAAMAAQGVSLKPGDMLLIRLGWVAAFRAAPTREERTNLIFPFEFSGLSGEAPMWEFLWDHKICAVATDTPTVEVWPIPQGRPSLHLAISHLGLVLGEMFDLDTIADDCAQDRRYEFLVTSSPLNLRGGVGSPPNAIVVK